MADGGFPYTHGMAIASADIDCLFCREAGGDVLFEDEVCRVVLVGGDEGAAFPGFCRIISQRHAREMSDLATAAQGRMFAVVIAAEHALRTVQQPHKINLASLGNLTPHVHWHVIPRWQDDSHFPAPIWSEAKRVGTARSVDSTRLRSQLVAEIDRLAA